MVFQILLKCPSSRVPHKYTFPIIQHGTHWYHSHTGLQEQIGMYGSFIMNKRNEDQQKGIDDLPTIPIILSEWTDMKPENVHRMHMLPIGLPFKRNHAKLCRSY
jgi:FtsP/CotA-like multicopper oxidase with cupredoxin domain